MFCNSSDKDSVLPVISREWVTGGNSAHVQCAGARALRPPTKLFFREGRNAPDHNAEAQASSEHRSKALFGVLCAMVFRCGGKRLFRRSAITMRLGWLARAAFVFSLVA